MADSPHIFRINELAKKKRTVGLTEEEQLEQKMLYKKYLAGFRKNLEAQLDNVYIVDPDGSEHKLKKK